MFIQKYKKIIGTGMLATLFGFMFLFGVTVMVNTEYAHAVVRNTSESVLSDPNGGSIQTTATNPADTNTVPATQTNTAGANNTGAGLTTTSKTINNFNDILGFAQNIMNILIVLFIGVATVIFMWGLIQYITQGGDKDTLSKARGHIVMGIVIITVMVSVYGLVNFVIKTFFPTDSLLGAPTVSMVENIITAGKQQFVSFVYPTQALAQTTGTTNFNAVTNTTGINSFKDLANFIVTTLNTLVIFLVGVAVFFFIFGLIKYVTAGDDEKKVKEARDYIIYGLIGIAVMFTTWGLVRIVSNTFFPNQGDLSIPQFK